MPKVDRNAVLNRLLRIHASSLPMYLASARPYTPLDLRDAGRALDAVIADHRRTIGILTEELLASGGELEAGEFPMEFTDLHDLSLGYLLKPLVDHQRRDLAAIEACVAESGNDPLAQEALGAAKAHLETLQEAAGAPSVVSV